MLNPYHMYKCITMPSLLYDRVYSSIAKRILSPHAFNDLTCPYPIVVEEILFIAGLGSCCLLSRELLHTAHIAILSVMFLGSATQIDRIVNVLVKLTPVISYSLYPIIGLRLTSHNHASHLHISKADNVSDVDICLMGSRVYMSTSSLDSSPLLFARQILLSEGYE
jgi:hypothetical protein